MGFGAEHSVALGVDQNDAFNVAAFDTSPATSRASRSVRLSFANALCGE